MKLKKKTKKPTGYHYDPRVDGVSQSMLEAWLNCRQLAYLKTILGLTPHAPARPLIHGSISHGAIKNALRKVMNGKTKDMKQLQGGVLVDIGIAFGDWEREHGLNVETAALDIAEESKAMLTQLLPVYWNHWGRKDLATKWTKVEDRFRVPIEISSGPTSTVVIPLVGQFDGVFERRGRPCLLETKNKSQWSEQLPDLLPLDLQVGVYLTALAALEKKDPSVVIYNLIRRPNERRSKNETLAGLAARVAKNAREDPEHYFQRIEVELTSQEKHRHKERVVWLLTEFYRWWQQLTVNDCFEDDAKMRKPFGDLRWNSSHCENKYGVCPYLRICGREDYSPFYTRALVHPELASP